MAGNFEANLGQFFSTDHFAQNATYTPEGGSPTTIKVIFEDTFKDLSPITGGYESKGPIVYAKTSDVSAAKHDETLLIGATTYYIHGAEPDGTGITMLRLGLEVAHG